MSLPLAICTSGQYSGILAPEGTSLGDSNGYQSAEGTADSSLSTDKRSVNKICRVCGDRAHSYNFNVITCESCKAFFRRNANRARVGMKKEWIMSDEARLEKKQRVRENRARRLAERAKARDDKFSNQVSDTASDRTRVPVQLRASQLQQQRLVATAAVASAVVGTSILVQERDQSTTVNQLDLLNNQFMQLGKPSQVLTEPEVMIGVNANDPFINLNDHMQQKIIEKQYSKSLNYQCAKRFDNKQKCTCTCRCGIYQMDKPIVDEIMIKLKNETVEQKSACYVAIDKCEELNSIDYTNLRTDNQVISNEITFNSDSKSNPSLISKIDYIDNDCLKDVTSEWKFVGLDEDDRRYLAELNDANQAWAQMDAVDMARHQLGCPSKLELVNMADGAIRRMIKMIKCISLFRSVDQHDQMQLLKESCLRYIIFRGAMSYDPSKNSWIGPTPDSGFSIKMDAMKETQKLFTNTIRFYATFKEEWRTNVDVMSVLGVLIIFNPETSNLYNVEAVNTAYCVYKKLLERLVYSSCQQNHRKTMIEVKGLLEIIASMKFLDCSAQQMITEVDTEALEPLLIEIFSQ